MSGNGHCIHVGPGDDLGEDDVHGLLLVDH